MISVKSMRRIGASALILPGLDHVIAPTLTMIFAPAILQTMFGESGAIPTVVFFVVLGVFQLIWIGVLLKSSEAVLLILGVIGNLISITIYFISAGGVTLPFDVPPQPLSAFAVLVKGLEALSVLASILLLRAIRSATP